MSVSNLYSINSEQVAASQLDGEVVVVHLKSTHYYNLNSSGALVWSRLEDSPCTLEEAVETVAREYGLETDLVRQDVQTLLDELVTEQIVSVR